LPRSIEINIDFKTMGQTNVDNRGISFISKDVEMKTKEDKIKDRVIKDNKIESKVVGEELTIQSSQYSL
jgi:hypothetical protein